MPAPTSTRGRHGGRRASGPHGEARDQPISFLIARSEQELLHAECDRRGIPRTKAGLRDLLLLLLLEQQEGTLAA